MRRREGGGGEKEGRKRYIYIHKSKDVIIFIL